MGNTLGHQKLENKPHRDRKCEKEKQKKSRQEKTSYKTSVSEQERDQPVSSIGVENEELSLMTEEDSGSFVSQSVDNVRISPDTSSRSHHEEAWSSASNQHRHASSARILHETTRPTTSTDSPDAVIGLSEDCHSEISSGSQGTASLRSALPPVLADEGRFSPIDSWTSHWNREQETNENQSRKPISPLPKADYHHPHFYNHHSDRKHRVVDRTSPQSPQITLPACKAISPGDPYASSTTQVLAQLRSNSQVHQPLTSDIQVKNTRAVISDRGLINELEAMSIQMCKTGERWPSSKPEQVAKISVPATKKKAPQIIAGDVAKNAARGFGKQETKHLPSSDQTWRASPKKETAINIETTRQDSCADTSSNIKPTSCRVTFPDERTGQQKTVSSAESEQKSASLSQTAAVCILKLEELERSIERTIRDKFSEESFLQRREELRGSRSLPTTPLLKKKLSHAQNGEHGETKLGLADHNGTTRFCEETYETAPRPARSPVILRRFGSRTRHASISPKVARAKTATLFNSPSDISGLTPSKIVKVAPKRPPVHGLSDQQSSGPDFAHTVDGQFSTNHKSKYDNDARLDFSDSYCPLLQDRPDEGKRRHVIEAMSGEDNPETAPGFTDTSSALFGSISPKLRRHAQDVFDDSQHVEFKEKTPKTSASDGSRTESASDEQLIANLEDSQTINTAATPASPIRLVSADSRGGMRNHKTRGHLRSRTENNTECSVIETCREDQGAPRGSTQTTSVKNQAAPRRSAQTTSVTNTAAPRSSTQTTSVINTAAPRSTTQTTSVTHDAASKKTISTSPPHTAGASLTHTAGMLHLHTAGTSRPHTAVTSPPHTTGVLHLHTAGTSRPHTAGTPSPHTADMLHLHTAGLPGAGMQKPGTEECSHSATDGESSLSTQHAEVCSAAKTDKVGQAGCCDSALKQVSDPSALGSAASLSYGSLAASPGHERANSGSRSGTHHSYNVSPYIDCHSRSENHQVAVENRQFQTKNLKCCSFYDGSSVVPSDSALLSHLGTDAVPSDSALLSHAGTDAVPSDSALLSDTGQLQHSDSQIVKIGQSCSESVSTRQQKCVAYRSADPVSSASWSACSSSVTEQKELTSDLPDAEDNNNHHQLYARCEKQVHERSQQPHTSSPQKVTVLKQPVSEVISQMINLSQQLKQHPRHPGHQATPPSQEELNLSHMKSTLPSNLHPATGLITLPTYQQPCQTLEHKTLMTQSISGKNIDHNGSNILTTNPRSDCFTQADVVVHRDVSPEESSDAGRSLFFPRPKGGTETVKDEQEKGDLGEVEFLRNVLAGGSQETRTFGRELKLFREAVPPPSPTSSDQLMKEVPEEQHGGSGDDDADDNEEAMSNLNKQLEIKGFSESIFKRLSDLLVSRSHSKLVVEPTSTPDDGDQLQLSVEPNTRREIDPASRSYAYSPLESSIGAVSLNSPGPSLFKVRTIDLSSSSLSTTTSSEFDGDETPLMFQTFGNDDRNEREDFNQALDKKTTNSSALEPHVDRHPRDTGTRRDSRVCHSDDDVATGRGIPDYYDDRPLWSGRQKPPGQLSATMMAVRWRERRDRWLKKRRRNRTDLLSTASSDTGSEGYPTGEHALLPEYSHCFGDGGNESRTVSSKEMGSGILTSPKYTKPIIPFFNSIHTRCSFDDLSECSLPLKTHQHSRSGSNFHTELGSASRPGEATEGRHAVEGSDEPNWGSSGRHNVSACVAGAASDVDDTFHELCSVQNILEKMQERRSTVDNDSQRQCLPLTTENVRSIREYYKDGGLSGLGRRSRLSATDRTESDFDIYSEMPDDVSSGSDLYADDEGDDEGPETYATADDSLIPSQRIDSSSKDRTVTSATEVVISRTFYNSSSQPGQRCGQTEDNSSDQSSSAHRSLPGSRIPVLPAALNSDEEFWAGNATAMEDSCRQLETTADAVSSTFQNARVQMNDIQHHLQALRRQMEVMQEDLTNISTTLSPQMDIQQSEKR